MPTNPFQPFKIDVSAIPLPEKFTFPFYYQPHKLSAIASEALQQYLKTQSDFEHNFGLQKNQNGLVIGKMFGVLVCQDKTGQLGYLWAFSGKLAETNHHKYFVPPVFDMLEHNSFYKKEENILNAITLNLEVLEQSETLKNATKNVQKVQIDAEKDIQRHKETIKTQKAVRDAIRSAAQNTVTFDAYKSLQKGLSEESKQESILFKKMTKYWNYQKGNAAAELQKIRSEIQVLKELRKQKSAALQQQLFDKYSFLNLFGIQKSIGEIFKNNPPAGAGECAAPKLLQYAFTHQLKPIAMAEFWWGQSPNSEIRKHKHFYPACKSKCEPILMDHMLDGLEVDDNPFLENPSEVMQLDIVYEDDILLLINKPPEFLSVPGKIITDSVLERLKQMYPDATGPLLVHRLDMSTSGLLLVAKNKETYVHLQKQFMKRTIKKRYVALLDGIVKQKEGIINLPLRVDLEDRPRQLVCYEYGKPAQTKWEVIAIKNKQTRVYFYPITGRTHQLRVHASHELGLKIPILGDDLYGKKANRLHLHAERLTFIHPTTREEITISVDAAF
ncbi:MAG: RNA pseudouridine synthase [Flavobacteriaceae bacterium CG18_big_fil_WC_8_21_14_2_50_34_36]|nr:RluA family pseudouridine synthase [Flavobacteriia bacterium]PIQ19335.1 MAG: RNA pseudouridine synthase [Flavobacteriaceae bacterium CG18_big_fil_WC_8_21_14_2_50_34_36]PIZ07892.1 MAG: RNA pseudouridine synthase [Flavobacteriaceae bacterium CG_4_10_14_0_8_um_filter_34_31]PJC06098.1 MAG: RNA pseudouridine synthase [Flavobacteriaceae bacterium CG_4_9_14_0_8_um_filter_34_30]